MSDLLKLVLSDTEYDLFYEHYNERYIDSLNIDNFKNIYNYLYSLGIRYINDLILRYLNLFDMFLNDVVDIFNNLEAKYGEDYIDILGKDLSKIEEFL